MIVNFSISIVYLLKFSCHFFLKILFFLRMHMIPQYTLPYINNFIQTRTRRNNQKWRHKHHQNDLFKTHKHILYCFSFEKKTNYSLTSSSSNIMFRYQHSYSLFIQCLFFHSCHPAFAIRVAVGSESGTTKSNQNNKKSRIEGKSCFLNKVSTPTQYQGKRKFLFKIKYFWLEISYEIAKCVRWPFASIWYVLSHNTEHI